MAASTALSTKDALDVDLTATIPCWLRRDAEATWHAFGRCPSCGTLDHTLVCDKCQKALASGAPTRCKGCNFSGPAKKFFTRTLRL